jgi:phage terminase Nu1 subunit (DNA packaging protein)
VRSYVEYRETMAAGEGGTSLTEERKRLTAERARIARLERRQLEAELIPADQIEPACLAWAANVRSHILAIPAKAAPLLGMCTTAAERLALLRRLVNEALDELSRLPVVIPGAGEASEPEQAEATH